MLTTDRNNEAKLNYFVVTNCVSMITEHEKINILKL